MSEASMGICSMLSYKFVEGSVGFLVPELEAKIVGPDGEKLGYNQKGEVHLRGPNLMMGYFNRPEENACAFDGDGFLCTDDIAYADEDNRFFITGRFKEAIKLFGNLLLLGEIETILLEYSKVNGSAAIGLLSDELQTELPKAYIVLTEDTISKIKENKIHVEDVCNDIFTWLDGRVADFKRLRGGIELVDNIPQSTRRKILCRKLYNRAATQPRPREKDIL